MDKLDTIFEMQDTLNHRIGVVTENLVKKKNKMGFKLYASNATRTC